MLTQRQITCIAAWNGTPRKVREAALMWLHRERRLAAARAGELGAIMGEDLVPDVPGAIDLALYIVEAFTEDSEEVE